MSHRYGVMEIFPTLQGEGMNAGRPSVFVRFSGCNLGYQVCPWCDTEWARANWSLDVEGVLRRVDAVRGNADLVVVTGGEPSLQFDTPLAMGLRGMGFQIAMETNGSRAVDRRLVDWLTVSPKRAEFAQKEGDELKVVYTARAKGVAPDVDSVRVLAEGTRFSHYLLQPIDLPKQGGMQYAQTVEAVQQLGAPWRLSLQTHKILGLR